MCVHKAYAAAGLRPPRDIVWEQSPAELAAGWAKRRAVAGDNVRALVVDVVRRKAELAVDRGIALNVRDTKAFTPYHEAEMKKWADVIKIANVQPQ